MAFMYWMLGHRNQVFVRRCLHDWCCKELAGTPAVPPASRIGSGRSTSAWASARRAVVWSTSASSAPARSPPPSTTAGMAQLRAGDLFHIPPAPHDSSVIGDKPHVSLHFVGADRYVERGVTAMSDQRAVPSLLGTRGSYTSGPPRTYATPRRPARSRSDPVRAPGRPSVGTTR